MRTLLVAIVASLLVSCASGAASPPSGGIEGTVTAGPTCPVEIQGSPCPHGVWTGTVRATASDGAVHEAQTDAHGRYLFQNILPGTYALRETQPIEFVDGKDTLGSLQSLKFLTVF